MKHSFARFAAVPWLFLAACSTSTDSPLSPSIPVAQDGAQRVVPALVGNWQLVSLQRTGQAPQPAPSGVRLTADFQADGHLALRADCNVCSAGYKAESGDELAITPMACTRAYCSSAPLDTDFALLVGAAQRAEVGASELRLVSDAGSVQMRR